MDDGSAGVEIAFELGFEGNALSIGVGDVAIVGRDVGIACILVVTVDGIVFLLLSIVAVLKVGEGLEETVKGVTSLHLEPDGVEEGLAERSGVDLVEELNALGFAHSEDGGGENDEKKGLHPG